MLSGIIPFYQEQFGIDGARIDMGHALPLELVNEIIRKARELNPEFTFIAEELDVVNAKDAKSKGYNSIIGDGFIREPRVYEGLFNSFVYGAMNLESPLFACGETHDTPRLAAREGGETLARMLTIFNLFVPNAIPFMNSGQEVFERQPMNTGLDCRVDEAEMLDPSDPYFGKLALFDRYAFHYLHPQRWEFMNLIQDANTIRQRILPALLDKLSTYPLGFSAPWDMAAGFGYHFDGKMTLIVANTDVFNPKDHLIRVDNLPEIFMDGKRVIRQIFSSDKNSVWPTLTLGTYPNISLHFEKGEVKILEIE
jgi:starch synthase (maltosyl-transferring)